MSLWISCLQIPVLKSLSYSYILHSLVLRFEDCQRIVLTITHLLLNPQL